jgi:hypothetical protein
MNRGCLTLFGLGLLSLFVFGVTLEALNDPKELSAIPFNPWDFLTYGLIALGILLLIRIVRKPDPQKTLTGKWTSDVKNERGRIRMALRLNQDGNAEIDIKGKVAGSDEIATLESCVLTEKQFYPKKNGLRTNQQCPSMPIPP